MQEEHAGAPRVRITTFGSLQVAYRSSSEEPWQAVAAEDWGETSYPRRLLCFLLFHRRQASRSKLLDVLWADNESVHLDATLNRTVSSLRRVLHGQELLTLHARTVYRLADQERVWWDYQAFETLWQEAERVGPTSEQGCLLLEQASLYVQHRQVLEDIEDRWCGAVRDKVEVAVYRMHLWLAEAYEAQERLREAEEQLEHVLSWEPLDGNALLRLMHVQAAQGYTSQALSRYQRACVQAAKDGRALPAEVETLARRLYRSPVLLPDTQELILPDAQMRDGGGVSLLVLPGGWRRIDTRLFELRQALLASWVQQWMGRAAECQALQAILAQEISMLDHHASMDDPELATLSRRKVLSSLVTIPAALLALQQGLLSTVLLEEFLPHATAGITACWYLINDGDFETVQRALATYLPSLETIVRQSDVYRTVAAHLAAQAYVLAGLISHHRGSLTECDLSNQKAVEYAQASEDLSLYIAAQRRRAYTLFYQLNRTQEALHLYRKIDEESMYQSPFLRSYVLSRLAVIQSQIHQPQEALYSINEAQMLFLGTTLKDIPLYLSSDFGSGAHLLLMGEARIGLGLRDPHGEHFQQAESIFADIEKLPDVPERFRLEALNRRAEVGLHRGDLDAFCAYLEQGIRGAQALGSQKRRQEVLELYKAVRQPTHKWRDEGRVKDLGDLLLH